jgi:hypothetical protein
MLGYGQARGGGKAKAALEARPVCRIETGEAGDFGIELQGNRAGWSVSLFADNNFGLTVNSVHFRQPFIMIGGSGTRLLVSQIVLFTVDE